MCDGCPLIVSRQTSSKQYSSQEWKALVYEEKFHVLWGTNKSAMKFFLKEFFFLKKNNGSRTNWGTNAIHCWSIYPKDKWEFGRQHEKLHFSEHWQRQESVLDLLGILSDFFSPKPVLPLWGKRKGWNKGMVLHINKQFGMNEFLNARLLDCT